MDNDYMESLLRLKSVMNITGHGRTTIYNGVRDGSFPKPILIGKRGKAWIKSEIAAYVKARIEQSRGKPVSN